MPESADLIENVETSEEPKSVKCDNHPGRKGRNYTGANSYSINLCDECTPPWFQNKDTSL